MQPRRTMVILVCFVAGVLAAFPAPASAAVCGTTEADSGDTIRGTLALDEEDAVTDRVFHRDTGHKTLSLIFKVGGCVLAADAPQPTLDVIPRKGSEELPANAVSLKRVTPDGSTLDVLIDVDSGRFDPGSYGALVVLRAPEVATTRTPIAVSRSDNRWLIPALIGIVAALAGLALFTLGQVARKATLASRRLLALVAGIAAVAGAVVVVVNYTNQEVWTFGENWWSAAVTGFTGATSGVMAGLLGGVWKTEDPAAAAVRPPA